MKTEKFSFSKKMPRKWQRKKREREGRTIRKENQILIRLFKSGAIPQ